MRRENKKEEKRYSYEEFFVKFYPNKVKKISRDYADDFVEHGLNLARKSINKAKKILYE